MCAKTSKAESRARMLTKKKGNSSQPLDKFEAYVAPKDIIITTKLNPAQFLIRLIHTKDLNKEEAFLERILLTPVSIILYIMIPFNKKL